MPAIGTAPCVACAREVVVRENGNGALNFSCAHCDLSMYAKKGTEAHKRLAPKVKRYELEQPAAPEKKPGEGKAPPAPAASKKYGYA